MDLADAALETFAPLLHQAFTLRFDAAAVEARLVEARSNGRAPAGHRQPFALVFATERGGPAAQGICAVEHPAVGVLELFVVPVGRNGAGYRYEACFG